MDLSEALYDLILLSLSVRLVLLRWLKTGLTASMASRWKDDAQSSSVHRFIPVSVQSGC